MIGFLGFSGTVGPYGRPGSISFCMEYCLDDLQAGAKREYGAPRTYVRKSIPPLYGVTRWLADLLSGLRMNTSAR